jgi:hypothetical protein
MKRDKCYCVQLEAIPFKRWKCGQFQFPPALPSAIISRYPLYRSLCELQRRSGPCGEPKHFLTLSRIKPPILCLPARSPRSSSAEPSRLRIHNRLIKPFQIELQRGLHFVPAIGLQHTDHSGRTVARSKIGIVDSNPSRGMDVCVRLFCLCCSVCR